jgi:hypothetical protein
LIFMRADGLVLIAHACIDIKAQLIRLHAWKVLVYQEPLIDQATGEAITCVCLLCLEA